MSIPSTVGVWLSLGPFALSGPVCLAISVGLWALMARQVFRDVRARLRQPWRRSEVGPAVQIFGVAGLLVFSIGAFHAYGAAQRLANAWWWQITPEEIAEVEVVRILAMNKPPVGRPVYLRDPSLVRDGFRRLADARFYERHHEIYQDGYRLRLRTVGAADFSERYLFVYRRSNDKEGCPAVVFERGLPEDDDETPHLAGEFLSPAFLQWVADVAEPRFDAPPP